MGFREAKCGHSIIVLLQCEVLTDLVLNFLLNLSVCVPFRVFLVKVDKSNIEANYHKQRKGQE